ncbi:MAG: hypothetical protein HQ526_05970 [Actinobacteria bacterium]|nr:hypothetical protein [Actinomycetota bacterium]
MPENQPGEIIIEWRSPRGSIYQRRRPMVLDITDGKDSGESVGGEFNVRDHDGGDLNGEVGPDSGEVGNQEALDATDLERALGLLVLV